MGSEHASVEVEALVEGRARVWFRLDGGAEETPTPLEYFDREVERLAGWIRAIEEAITPSPTVRRKAEKGDLARARDLETWLLHVRDRRTLDKTAEVLAISERTAGARCARVRASLVSSPDPIADATRELRARATELNPRSKGMRIEAIPTANHAKRHGAFAVGDRPAATDQPSLWADGPPDARPTLKELGRTLRVQPWNEAVRLALLERLTLAARTEEAIRVANGGVVEARHAESALHFRAWSRVLRDDERGYGSWWRLATWEGSLLPLRHLRALGLCATWFGAFDWANRAYDRALSLEPDDLGALTRSHNALAASGRWLEAMGRLARAVARDDGNAEAHKLLGVHLSGVQALSPRIREAAIRAIGHGSSQGLDYPETWSSRAEAMIGIGDRAAAGRLVRRRCESAPSSYQAWMVAAKILSMLGEWEEAREAGDKAYALNPDDPETTQLSLLPHLVLGSLEKACDRIRRYVETWHNWPESCYDSLLLLLTIESERSYAIGALSETLDSHRESASMLLRHAALEAQMGSFEVAQALFQDASSRDPSRLCSLNRSSALCLAARAVSTGDRWLVKDLLRGFMESSTSCPIRLAERLQETAQALDLLGERTLAADLYQLAANGLFEPTATLAIARARALLAGNADPFGSHLTVVRLGLPVSSPFVRAISSPTLSRRIT